EPRPTLEPELRAEFRGERMRSGDAARRDIPLRLLETRRADCAAIVVAIVGAIGQVEELGDQVQLGFFAEVDRLRNAGIPLEEGSAAEAVEIGPDTVAGSDASASCSRVESVGGS